MLLSFFISPALSPHMLALLHCLLTHRYLSLMTMALNTFTSFTVRGVSAFGQAFTNPEDVFSKSSHPLQCDDMNSRFNRNYMEK